MNCILSVVQFVQPTEPDEIRVISRYILIACLSHCRTRDMSGTQLKECHHSPGFSKVGFPNGLSEKHTSFVIEMKLCLLAHDF